MNSKQRVAPTDAPVPRAYEQHRNLPLRERHELVEGDLHRFIDEARDFDAPVVPHLLALGGCRVLDGPVGGRAKRASS